MRSTATVILVLGLAATMGGCASMGGDECRHADWRAVGFEDGAKGINASYFGERRKACAKHGVTPNFEAYLHGRGEGLVQYCRPQNGYTQGTRGKAYAGVCPDGLEAPFVAAHADGMGLYQRHRAVKQAAKRLYRAEARGRRIEQLLVSKTQALISTKTPPQKRPRLALDLKQLTEEKVGIEQSLHDLEHDHAVAEQEFEAYRAGVGDRHR